MNRKTTKQQFPPTCEKKSKLHRKNLSQSGERFRPVHPAKENSKKTLEKKKKRHQKNKTRGKERCLSLKSKNPNGKEGGRGRRKKKAVKGGGVSS